MQNEENDLSCEKKKYINIYALMTCEYISKYISKNER